MKICLKDKYYNFFLSNTKKAAFSSRKMTKNQNYYQIIPEEVLLVLQKNN